MSSAASKLHALSTELAELVERGRGGVLEVLGGRVPASATLWTAEGLAVTVAHAMGRRSEGELRLPDGRKVAARVLGRDPSFDLALLQVELPEDFDAAAALLPRREASARVGELVLALGQRGAAVQANLGMVARVAGSWRTRFGASVSAYIEVDGELARGSSGGPLLDASGALIGIDTHGLVRGGTTVPAADVDKAVARLREGGDRRPGFLGVRFSPARLADHPERERALLVIALGDDSPAAKAGIKVGDAILSVEGEPVQRGDDLLAALSTRADEATRIELWRAGAALEVTATPVPRGPGRGRGHGRRHGGHRPPPSSSPAPDDN